MTCMEMIRIRTLLRTLGTIHVCISYFMGVATFFYKTILTMASRGRKEFLSPNLRIFLGRRIIPSQS